MGGLTLVARRTAQALPLLLLVSVGVFGLLHAAPGGPLAIYLENPNVRPADLERLRVSLGLDRPLAVQYLSWLRGILTGDWGFSFTDGRPVAERILERLPATLELVAASLVVALLAAVPAGVVTALRRGRGADRVVDLLTIAGISLPAFWLGLLLQLVFAVWLGWLPSSGRTSLLGAGPGDRLAHLALPALTLAALHAAAWTRYLRSAMGQALVQRYTLAARGRGIPDRRVAFLHALRNALLPFLTVVLLDAAIMVSGAVMTESVFSWPGLGGLFTESLARRDYPVLMAFLMLSAIAVIAMNLVADLAYRWLDPRVRA